MTWYLRKALRLGPIRLNLSKRGVGASTGVKGARLDVDASGKPYAAGGRYGLYFSVSGSGRRRARTSTRSSSRRRPVSSSMRRRLCRRHCGRDAGDSPSCSSSRRSSSA